MIVIGSIRPHAALSLPRERSECGDGAQATTRSPFSSKQKRRCSAPAMREATTGSEHWFAENLHGVRVYFEDSHPGLRFAPAFPPRKREGEESASAIR